MVIAAGISRLSRVCVAEDFRGQLSPLPRTSIVEVVSVGGAQDKRAARRPNGHSLTRENRLPDIDNPWLTRDSAARTATWCTISARRVEASISRVG